jgi:hypothetical protein
VRAFSFKNHRGSGKSPQAEGRQRVKFGIKDKEFFQPQKTQMDADSEVPKNICADLRNLRLTFSQEAESKMLN